MDIFLIIIGAICLLIGILGCVLPVLPGVPLAYCGLLLLHATDKVQFSWQFLVIWAVVTIVVQVLDSVVPIWGTKKFGGSKMGVWGSTIGLLIGLFFGPWGIVLGPFLGAVIFELIDGKNTRLALKAGWGSFVGLMTGTILKLICCGLMTYYFIAELI
ncbi:MAG: DUF456 domain-containing protein [Paludibacteraceae bacterium]|nr:DUF456 domain-containing protein [Paludibacteraceae bacterium]